MCNQLLLAGCLIRQDLEALLCQFSPSEKTVGFVSTKLCGHVWQSQSCVFTVQIYIFDLSKCRMWWVGDTQWHLIHKWHSRCSSPSIVALLGKDKAQAKEAAATISSSLGEGWVFSLPPAVLIFPLSHPLPLFSWAENVFVLPFVFTNGCWGGREAGILSPPRSQPSLILARSELQQRHFELSAEMSAGEKRELVGFALKIK